jgi:prepilin peptidase CpaA
MELQRERRPRQHQRRWWWGRRRELRAEGSCCCSSSSDDRSTRHDDSEQHRITATETLKQTRARTQRRREMFVIVGLMNGGATATALWACLGIALFSALLDIKWRRIPNLLTIGGIVLGISIHAAVGYADGGAAGVFRGAIRAVIGMTACAALPIVSFIRREMGGGDVKLFAAIGALLGPLMGLTVEGFTFVLTIAFVLPCRVVQSGAAKVILENIHIAIANLRRRRSGTDPLPYVPAKKLPPVIMGPTILAAFLIVVAQVQFNFLAQ